MPIPVKCKCGKQIAAPDNMAGKRAKCPGCGETLSIPAAGQPAATSGSISVKCNCGKSFAAPSNLAGKTVKCPGCQQPIKVASVQGAMAKGSASTRATETTDATCNSCGKSFRAPAKLAGKTVACPGCKQPVQIPGNTKPAVAAKSSPSDDDSGIGALLDEVGFQRASAQNRCPECKHDMGPEDVLCVNCGYHLETGKQLKTHIVEKKNQRKSDSESQTPRKKAGNEDPDAKKKKMRLLLGGALLIIAIVALVISRR